MYNFDDLVHIDLSSHMSWSYICLNLHLITCQQTCVHTKAVLKMATAKVSAAKTFITEIEDSQPAGVATASVTPRYRDLMTHLSAAKT